MGENSGLQENHVGSVMDLDNMGHDFSLKECSVSPYRSFHLSSDTCQMTCVSLNSTM
jgi:hypothetical protein